MMKKLAIIISLLTVYLPRPIYGAVEFRGVTRFSEKEISRVIDRDATPDSAVSQVLNLYGNIGYFNVEIAKIESTPDGFVVYLNEGEPSLISRVNLVVTPDSALSYLRDYNHNISGKVASQAALQKYAKGAIAVLADNGMPFARGEWSRFQMDGDGNVEGDLRIIAGPRVVVSAVEFNGIKRTQPGLLRKTAGLHLGAYYSETKTVAAGRMIDKMPYLEVVSPFYLETSVTGDSCVIIFNLKELASTRFDGAGGFVKIKDKTDFIGRIEMKFGDILGTGREFGFYWNKKDARSNELRIEYLEPFVLNSRMDLRLSVFQTDRDTLFIKTGGTVGFYRRFGADLTGTIIFSLERTVPESNSSVSNSIKKTIGTEFDFNKTDFPPNPKSGYEVGSNLDYGYRSNRIVVNGENPPTSISSAGLDGSFYYNTVERFVTAIRFNGWGITSSNGTVPLDEYRFIGGTNGLRGYAEQQFPAYRYLVGTLETRLITGNYSRAYLFGDFGFIKSSQESRSDFSFRPGYGFGLVSRTKLGTVKVEIGWGDVGFPSDAVFNFGFGGGF